MSAGRSGFFCADREDGQRRQRSEIETDGVTQSEVE